MGNSPKWVKSKRQREKKEKKKKRLNDGNNNGQLCMAQESLLGQKKILFCGKEQNAKCIITIIFMIDMMIKVKKI